MTLDQLVERERARVRLLVALEGTLAALAVGALLLAAGIALFGGARWIALPAPLPLASWALALSAIAFVAWQTRRALEAGASRARIAEAIEREGNLRRGMVRGALEVGAVGPLGQRGAAMVAGQLAARGAVLAPALRRQAGRRGLVAGAIALVLLVAAAGTGWAWPDGWQAMAHPIAAWRGTLLPAMRIDAPSAIVRGERLTLQVEAPGRRSVTLQARARGRAWVRTEHAVKDGWATVTLPPLDADLAVLAQDGRVTSDTVLVKVADRPFVGDVAIRAIYPAYLGRRPEPLAGGEIIRVPQGTVLQVEGRASTRLRTVALAQGVEQQPLVASGHRFGGRVAARAGRWEWRALGIAGPVSDLPPALELEVVPDSAPTIAIVHPGSDTTITPNDKVAVGVEAGDDHGLGQVVLRAWKVGKDGRAGAAVLTSLGDDAGGRWAGEHVVDASAYGLVPGEALHLVAEARDASPWSQRAESAPIVLRIPDLAEQRELARRAADSTVAAAVAAAGAQKQLAQRTGEAARSRGERSNAGNQQAQQSEARGAEAQAQAQAQQGPKTMSFESAEKARALAREQRELGQKVEQLRESARQLEKQLKQAGAMDSALQQRLREAQDLLREALTPELQERLQQLEEAAQKMQADQSRAAMSELAEQQQRLREALEKSVEMLRRAALEGAMETLKDDAKELAAQQRQLADSLQQGGGKDDAPRSGARDPQGDEDARARQLADRTKRIAEEIAQLEQRLKKEQAQTGAERAAQAEQHARESAKDMERAAKPAGKAPDTPQQVASKPPQEQKPRVDAPADVNKNNGDASSDRAQSQSQQQAASQQQKGASQQAGQQKSPGQRQQGGQPSGEQPGGEPQRAEAARDAAEQMDNAAQRLEEAREQQISEWKEELTQELDRAIQETLQLARQEEELAEQVQQAGNSAQSRAQQSSVQQGAQQAGDRLQQAGKKSSHLSGGTQRAMQEAQRKVQQATEQTSEGGSTPQRTAQAMREAASALNQAAASMVRDRERANQSSSASGFSEMLEQMRQNAQKQAQLNQRAGGMSAGQQGGGMPGAGARQIAQAQRGIARSLEEAGEGTGEGGGRAQALAKEAEEIARQIERQGLDPATLDRQQRLYRKLLDAGRAMEQDERDETGKREATSAKDGERFTPDATVNGRPAAKFREPTWAELRGLSPEERRLVLEYFKRINATP